MVPNKGSSKRGHVSDNRKLTLSRLYWALHFRDPMSDLNPVPPMTGSVRRTLCRTCVPSFTVSPKKSQSWRDVWGNCDRRQKTGTMSFGPNRTSPSAGLEHLLHLRLCYIRYYSCCFLVKYVTVYFLVSWEKTTTKKKPKQDTDRGQRSTINQLLHRNILMGR